MNTTWLRPATWRATSTPVISGIWMSRNMKSGARSSSASSAAAPSSTEAMMSSSGQSFFNFPSSCARRMPSSSATIAVGMDRLCLRAAVRGFVLAPGAAHQPPDAEPDQDEGRDHRKERDQYHQRDEDGQADEEEPQPVDHGEHDGERQHHHRDRRRDP